MQRDRQRRVVQLPQRLEHQFRLCPRIDEYDRHPGIADMRHHLWGGFQPHMAGPGQPAFRHGDGDLRRCAVRNLNPTGCAGIGLDGVRMGHRGGQPHPAGGRSERCQTGDAQCQLIAALGAGKGVDFVQHDAGKGAEEIRCVGQRQQHRQAFRRGQQNMRRCDALAGSSVGWRVTGAGLDDDRQSHLGDGAGQVAGDVGGQRLQGADIDGVQARTRCGGQIDKAGQEAR